MLALAASVAATPFERATAACANMTLSEKLGFVHGIGINPATPPYTGVSVGVPRLGIPPVLANDGPQGFRDGQGSDGISTQFPGGLAVAASWNKTAAFAWGAAMGAEFKAKRANVQLGPGMCLARLPQCGRNFEYVTGEDPVIGYHLAKQSIQGIQSQGIVANAKHFIANNQETHRGEVNVLMDDRTLHELYYPPFQGAVDAEVGSVMCSYNKIGGRKSCNQSETLTKGLREEMGFKGWVMSDWWAADGTLNILAGLDQEFPGSNTGDSFFGSNLKNMIESGDIPQADLDQSVIRILTQFYKLGIIDNPNTGNITQNSTTSTSTSVALSLAEESTVLLQIVLVGDNAHLPDTSGSGSGAVAPSYAPNPFDSISAKCVHCNVVYAPDGPSAANLSQTADLAIVFISVKSGEGNDRPSLNFSGHDSNCCSHGQACCYGDQMVSQVAAAFDSTIVVATAPGAVTMPWSKDVCAILLGLVPGQMWGPALANLLFGDSSPSGKLPLTLPNIENEQGFTPGQFPGTNGGAGNVTYSEGLYVGYRWYDKNSVKPKFPFGHGLQYTGFAFADLTVNKTAAASASITLKIANNGTVDAAEVVQLYLAYPPSAGEPPLVLKGFEKRHVAAGSEATISFQLQPRDFSIWDTAAGNWSVAKGSFGVKVGASSRDLRLADTIII